MSETPRISPAMLKGLQDLDDDIAMTQVTLREKQATFQRLSTEAIKSTGLRAAANMLCLNCGSVVKILQRTANEIMHEPCPVCTVGQGTTALPPGKPPTALPSRRKSR